MGADGAEPQPGTVEARWDISRAPKEIGSSLSISQLKPESKGKGKADESDPFADDTLEENGGRWTEVETVKTILSGKYEAK